MTKTEIYQRYDEQMKKNLVTLHASGKTQSAISKEYGVSESALSKLIKQYSTVHVDDSTILTAQQINSFKSAMLNSKRRTLSYRVPFTKSQFQ